jgi:hypothetical protein
VPASVSLGASDHWPAARNVLGLDM